MQKGLRAPIPFAPPSPQTMRPNGDAFSDLRGSIRHGANDGVVFQPGADLMEACAGNDRKHQRVRTNPFEGLHHLSSGAVA